MADIEKLIEAVEKYEAAKTLANQHELIQRLPAIHAALLELLRLRVALQKISRGDYGENDYANTIADAALATQEQHHG